MNAETTVTRDAGRDLDALVAEQVMGVPMPGRDEAPPPYQSWLHHKSKAWHWHFGDDCWLAMPYSTDIGAAWEVVEKLGADMGLYYHGGIPEYEATFFGSCDGVAYVVTDRGETAPLAICRAALRVAPRDSGNP